MKDNTDIIPGLVIVPESDVPPPTIRRTISDATAYEKAIAKMEMGQSFFLEGRRLADVEFLFKIAESVGVTLTGRNVKNDEVYQVAGVRFWRVEPESAPPIRITNVLDTHARLDEFFDKNANAIVEVMQAKKKPPLRYWHDKNHGLVVPSTSDLSYPGVEEVSFEQYEVLKKSYESDEL